MREGAGRVTGFVQDFRTGRALAGVTITVSGEGGGAATGPEGGSTIPNVLTGIVTVTATHAGYAATSRAAGVEADRTVSLTLPMLP